ncbi:MAG TPA: excinuclease ABC subunit UvrB [Phycisphaerae bacterium]|nr:excinuclease ABC subunit UvrB [Phycisphaerae bacterium]HOJ75168.1 excinuclease ABC subunit UvrB [Phycisphaerae bacterium]HOM52481.1 excinuclease ABC subunit UvrB [Phycisphaerae bacterium]HON66399.1 excinuclease ABC subunit UvrB [Phycisphaerae bacterium]HOQ87706.1 excinuclease ABC subunit UvrB [Phycisphaerae bacterium]
MPEFKLVSPFKPAGDQPAAIEKIVEGFRAGRKFQTLLGVTGSGKTFTMAHVIAALNRPALVISHNKTLAAQLYEEFSELFPENAVEYFVSYYDYYQPEAYIPQRDIYIEKDASRNDDLDRLRLSATSSLVSRRDTIIVASVSCIFGLGSPEDFKRSVISVTAGTTMDRDELLRRLVDLQYSRNDIDFRRGTFRVRGDVVEVHPADEEFAYRIELFGDEVDRIDMIDPLTGRTLASQESIFIFPAVHYVMPEERIAAAIKSIQEELDHRVMELRQMGKLLEAQRLLARTKYDLEMIQETGYCSGIENYSRHLNGMPPGSRPFTLIDYFPEDYVLFIDESHVTVPQIRAMYQGDRNRKETLVEHGFRLPSCLDNRPLRFEEFEQMWNQVLFVSATPGPYELKLCGGEVVEQIIRPTGLVDPVVQIKPARGQVPDLLDRISERVAMGERVLVTTLTKRLAEDLSAFIEQKGFRGKYLHSEIDTLERVEILNDLRRGEFDVLVGVNLLREGLDLPEVSLVAIMDADKEGFLRSETSLIQTIGRTARNVNAEVILYGDKVTPSMQRAMDETNRRREIQLAYNAEHGITPETIVKAIRNSLEQEISARKTAREAIQASEMEYDRAELISKLEAEMFEAAQALDFERAARIRDRIRQLEGTPILEKVAGKRKL